MLKVIKVTFVTVYSDKQHLSDTGVLCYHEDKVRAEHTVLETIDAIEAFR